MTSMFRLLARSCSTLSRLRIGARWFNAHRDTRRTHDRCGRAQEKKELLKRAETVERSGAAGAACRAAFVARKATKRPGNVIESAQWGREYPCKSACRTAISKF